MKRQSLAAIMISVILTVPWVVVWSVTTILPTVSPGTFLGIEYHVPGFVQSLSASETVIVSGLAVLGAAFLLAWGAETAEKDVPRAFAIAVLAVLAVAPEYAVDALYAWNAGVYSGVGRGIEAGNLAVANMTGANRILIGLGWAGIALYTIYWNRFSSDPAVEKRSGYLSDVVTLDRDIGLEIVFLLLATLWAFLVPLNGGIDIFDMIFLVGIYIIYISIVLRGDIDHEEEHDGVPGYLQTFSKGPRVLTVILLFAYSGLLIFTAVEPFAHGLEQLGTDVGVPSFFMIQWIAPLASESPELIVVAYMVNKARSTAGFNALISSKLNQWTLLIGTLVVVHSLALGQYGVLQFNQKQAAEIWLTAAQSLFAISILFNFEISVREALGLFLLFASQVVIEFLLISEIFPLSVSSYELLLVFTGIYIALAATLFVSRRDAFQLILRQTAGTVNEAVTSGEKEGRSADD